MALQPNNPIVNAPNLYVNGLGLHWPVATPLLLNVSAGQCRDSTNVNDIFLENDVVVNAALVGLNGLDTGSLQAGQMYAVYIIGDSTGYNSAGCLLSLNVSQPHMPAGYDMFRRIGWAPADGALAQLAKMEQYGQNSEREYFYGLYPGMLVSGNATVWTQVNLGTTVPNVDNLKARLELQFHANVSGAFVSVSPYQLNFASLPFLYGPAAIDSFGATLDYSQLIYCPYAMNGADAAVVYVVSNAADTLNINVAGFSDSL